MSKLVSVNFPTEESLSFLWRLLLLLWMWGPVLTLAQLSTLRSSGGTRLLAHAASRVAQPIMSVLQPALRAMLRR